MSRLNLSFFGTFQVTLDRQPVTHFRSANNQGLLVYLAMQSGKPISRDLLATLFWPEESTRNGRSNLRQSLHRLRNLLGDSDEPETPYLLVTRQTVQFNPESSYELDVQEFLDAVDEGELETAVSHYHGDLLPGITCDSLEFEEWLRQERETLHALALETMVEAARDCLRDGRLDQAQAIARQQLSLEPWREQAHRQLMQAFALAGDRGGALAQYDICREVLGEELGIEPAAETVKLYEDIKTGRIGAISTAEPLQPPLKIRHNLPADITPLIGRELELSQVSQLLVQEAKRFVSIVGPGGMGKTRLAIAVGTEMLSHFQDGVYFVDLSPLNHPNEIPQAIAAVLDYQAPDKRQPLFPQLLTMLSRQKLFLILDNFEHLLAGANWVTDILQACPNTSILVTSRQRLNLATESRYELGGLTFPDWLTPEDALDYTAVQLFLENGRQTLPDFVLTNENVTDVVRVCQLVQGMPLGLVLATSWLQLLGPGEIAAEIEGSLDFLTAEMTDLPPRQRSMQAVFDYSWQSMTQVEQAVLARLSVFRGGFTREAAVQVAGANLRVLLSLVNKSLLQRQTESGRFEMHELLRQFAASQRQQIDINDDALFAHCRYFARQLRADSQQGFGLIPNHLPTKFSAERDNLFRAWEYALEHGLAEELAGLASGIVIFTMRQGTQARAVPARALQALRQRGHSETDSTMLYLKLLEQSARGGTDDSHKIREQMMELAPFFERETDLELRYWFYKHMAFNLGETDDPAELEWMTKAYEIALEIGDDVLINSAEMFRLWIRFGNGNYDESFVEQTEGLLAFFEPKFLNSFNYYATLGLLHAIHTANGDFEKAIQYGSRSLNLAKLWQDLLWISTSLMGLAENYEKMGMTDEARLQHLDALDWHLAIGQTWQLLGFLYAEAVDYPGLIGGQESAAFILSMVYHQNEVADYHKILIDEAVPQLKDEMGAEAFMAAWEKGKGMDLETAVNRVRAALTS